MKNILALPISVVFAFSQLWAQQTVTGYVSDQDGIPIAGVSILVKGTKTGTSTDDKGYFSIEAAMGNVLIFSSVNYEMKELRINQASVSIRLSLLVKPLEELVVSGNVVATKRRADVSSVTVLTSKDLEALPGFNLVNILEGVVPGVTITAMPTTIFRVGEYFNSGISVRGAGIKVYVDDVEFAAGSSFLAMLNKDDIERIEMVRGPSAATLYGSGAIGGVMLIYTKKGKANRTMINVKTSAGFQRSDFTEQERRFQQSHNAEFLQGIKNFSYALGGHYRTQNDYLPEGSLKIGGAFANFTFHTGKFKFVLSNNFNINKTERSRYAIFDNTEVEDYYWSYTDSAYVKNPYKIHSGTVSLNTEFQPARWWTHNLVLGYSENNRHAYPNPSVYTDTTKMKYYMNHGDVLGAQDWTSKDQTPTIRYFNLIKPGNPKGIFKTDLLSGFEYSNTKYHNVIYNTALRYTTSGGYTFRPNRVSGGPFNDYKREFTGAYIQSSSSWQEKYFLVAGLRYEKSNVSIAVLNPKVGFTTNFELSTLIFKPRINWGRSIISPPYHITHPPPPSGPITFIANPDIKPQEQTGLDVAIEIYDKKNRFKTEIIRYNNIDKNRIYTEFTPVNNGTAAIVTYTNIGKIAKKGWEFIAEYKISRFKITGNYSIINVTYVDSFENFKKGDKVRGVPKYAAGASLNYTVPRVFGKSDYLSATLIMTSSGKMIAGDNYQWFIDNAKYRMGLGPMPVVNIRETPGVTKFNLNIDYQFHPNLRLFIQAWNFTDNTTPDFDKGFPVPGASWMFGLNLNFNKSAK